MSTGIYAGNLQRTGEYQTRGLRTLQGVRWSFQTQEHIHFPPLVAHGMVYVGSNDGCFYALGTHTGVPQWRFETECASLPTEEYLRMDNLEHTGITSVQLTESTAFFGTASGIIYGLDLETGQPTWRFVGEEPEEEEEIDPTGIFHMIVAGDLLLFWSKSGLSAVDVTTKERLWLKEGLSPFTDESLIDSLTDCPTVADQMLYGITTFFYMNSNDPGAMLYAYDISTQAWVWDDISLYNPEQMDARGYGHCATGVIPVANGTAYFVAWTPEDEGPTCLVAVDARTGTLQWSFALEQDGGYGGYTALANNIAYVVKESGNVFAIDLTTHEARWTRQLKGFEYAPPSLADGILYLPRYDGLITALDALTGQDLWTVQLDGVITTPCTIADGVVYVAASTTVYALH